MTKTKSQKIRAKAAANGVRRLQGRGAYNFVDSVKNLGRKIDSVASKIPKGTFRTIGSAFGPKGAAIGQALSTITGYGSYDVNHNTIMTSTQVGAAAENIPTFQKGSHGSTITHREFIRNVVVPSAPNDFNNTSERLAVDNASVFPWLSRLSTRYQRYKVKGMVFQYRSTSTDYNNSGTIAIAVNYNATERPYTNMPAVLNSQFACSSKPSVSFFAPVECDPKSHPDGFYIRHENEISGVTDVRMSSIGILNVVTAGLSLPVGTVLGELWVTYEIELISPYMGSDFSMEANFAVTTKTFNDLTRVWDTVAITDTDSSNPPFMRNFVDANTTSRELVLSTFNTDANFTRPRLDAVHQTGTRTYFIELSCNTSVGQTNNWMPSASTVQPSTAPNATVLWNGATVAQSDATSQGAYVYRAFVRFRPGETFSPWAQGVHDATGTGALTMFLLVSRSGQEE